MSKGVQRNNEFFRPKKPYLDRAVYFIVCNDEFVKIGFSDGKVLARIKSVIGGIPYPCQVALILHGKGHAFEQELHVHFNSARTKGEWFRFTPEIREFIKNAQLQNTPVSI